MCMKVADYSEVLETSRNLEAKLKKNGISKFYTQAVKLSGLLVKDNENIKPIHVELSWVLTTDQ